MSTFTNFVQGFDLITSPLEVATDSNTCHTLPDEFKFDVISTGQRFSMKLTKVGSELYYLCDGTGYHTVKFTLGSINDGSWRIVE